MSGPTRSPGLFLAALFGLLLPGALSVAPLSDFQSGTLTFFGGAPDGMNPSQPSYGTKDGACGYGTIPNNTYPYFSTAALSPQNSFYKSLPLDGCGACFEIQCTDPRSGACKIDSTGAPLAVLAVITDSCPQCDANHIDLQALAFAKIAQPSLGKVQMQYRRVQCLVPQNIQVSVMNFVGAGGWLRLTVDDTGGRGSVKALYVKGSSSSNWEQMTNTWGAAWELSNAPQPPLDFKFECDDGEEVTATDVLKQNGGISGGLSSPVKFSTNTQFSITDPAAQQVQAYSGSSDPTLVTSSTPGNTGIKTGSGGSSSPSSPSPSPSPNSNSTSPSPSPSPSGSPSPSPSPSGSPSPSPSPSGSPSPSPSPSGSPSPSPSPSGSPSPSPSPSSSSSSSSCTDVAPPGQYSCQQQKSFGKCSASFITSGDYCAATCGRCSGSSSAGRRLLGRRRFPLN